ncbi:MAG TPA: triple tyrosine motif-containing protein, partial [Puia sp.]|nr:triple tyrosine motif-containing protein [Puia sp.]
EDGFYRVDNSSGHISQIKSGSSFSFMFLHHDGNLIVSSENHLFIFRPPDRFMEIEKKYPEFSSIKSQNINSAVYCGDSVALLGSEDDKGVYSWNFKLHSIDIINSQSASPLKSDIVNTVYKDHSGRIWILSDNSFALYYPENKKLINYKLKNPGTGQPLNLFFDVRETEGSYWLAAYGSGIIELDPDFRIKKIIASAQGMANSGVYKIFPVHDSLLYVTSNNGLCKINVLRNSVTNYFKSDGLHSNAFEEGCGMDKNGKIYAGGLKGFSIINTEYLGPNNQPPDVYFNNVLIQTSHGSADTSNLFMESVVLPPNTLRADIYFCGINYSNPEKTVYAFRIKEQNESWISLGTDNHMVVSGIPPGTYTLQVRAANEDGLWSEPVGLTIHFLPKWYQSDWFKVLIFICLGGILYALYRYRIGQLKKTLVMRTKISQDLHDEVGSSLSGIGLMSELAKQQLKTDNIPEAQNAIDKIIVNADEVLAMMSDIVWAINPKNDTFEKMITRLRSYAQNTTTSHHIVLHFETEENAQQYNLTMQQRKNIYLICKESINNAVRYSGCRNLYFILRRDRNQFYICVRDDGKGFDMEQPSEGNGLQNMRARAKEVKAVLHIESRKEIGTAITVLLRIT